MMTDLYNYCTKCGDEMEKDWAEKYEESDETLPPLCRVCLTELFEVPVRSLAESIVQFNRTIMNALDGLGESLQQSFNSNEDPDDDEDFEDGGEVVG